MANNNGQIDGLDDDYIGKIADLDTPPNGADYSSDDGDGFRNDQQEQQYDENGNPIEPSGGQSQQDADQANQSQEQYNQQASSQEGQQPQQTPQGQQQEQAPQLRKHAFGDYVDSEGNIVNEKGEMIAPRGAARRIYESSGKVKQRADRAEQELQELRHHAQQTQLLNGIPQQYGLTNEEVARGLDWERRMKSGDVLGVAKDVVALLAAKGHNISELVGENVGDAIDMRALNQMLNERLAPIQRQEQQQQQTSQQEQAARQAYDRFVQDNEYADLHGDTIVAVMQRQNVGQQQAYNMVRDFISRNGFDISQPLGPQIEAYQQRQQQQQPPQRGNNQQQQSRPMPNGASTRGDGVNPATPVYADPDDPWAEIIRGAMAADASQQ